MKEILKNSVILILSTLICLIVLEVIFRIFIPVPSNHSRNDSDFIQPDSLLSYRYIANLDTNLITEDYEIQIQTNSLGFRDVEWSIDASHTNILVVGNSFTAGFGINVDHRWSDLIEAELSNTESIQVYNAAVSGYSITQSVDNGIELSKTVQPEVIIIGLYLNSLDRLDDPFQFFEGYSVKKSSIEDVLVLDGVLYKPFWKNKTLQSLEVFFKRNSVLYRFAEERIRFKLLPSIRNFFNEDAPSLDSSNQNKELSKRAFDELQRLQSYVPSEIYLLPIIQHNRDFEVFQNQIEIYNELVYLCQSSTITFIDIKPPFEKKIREGVDMWINNDAHWNETAHALAAEIVLEQLTFD